MQTELSTSFKEASAVMHPIVVGSRCKGAQTCDIQVRCALAQIPGVGVCHSTWTIILKIMAFFHIGGNKTNIIQQGHHSVQYVQIFPLLSSSFSLRGSSLRSFVSLLFPRVSTMFRRCGENRKRVLVALIRNKQLP